MLQEAGVEISTRQTTSSLSSNAAAKALQFRSEGEGWVIRCQPGGVETWEDATASIVTANQYLGKRRITAFMNMRKVFNLVATTKEGLDSGCKNSGCKMLKWRRSMATIALTMHTMEREICKLIRAAEVDESEVKRSMASLHNDKEALTGKCTTLRKDIAHPETGWRKSCKTCIRRGPWVKGKDACGDCKYCSDLHQ